MDLSRLGSVVRTQWGAASDQGPRPSNQDHWVAQPPLYAVADGMGGHTNGERASQLGLQTFAQALSTETLGGREADVNDLDHAISAAAQAVMALAFPSSMGESNEEITPIVMAGAPGTTLTGVLITAHSTRPQWLVFNVGDSRTYLINDGRIRRLTKDHSALQEARDAQWDESALPAANIITRALGGGMPGLPQADFTVTAIAPGDRIVMCSDGVHCVVDDEQIAALVTRSSDAQLAANALVDAAIEQGTRDNSTALTVFVDDVNPPWPDADPVDPRVRLVGIARPSSTQTIRRQSLESGIRIGVGEDALRHGADSPRHGEEVRSCGN